MNSFDFCFRIEFSGGSRNFVQKGSCLNFYEFHKCQLTFIGVILKVLSIFIHNFQHVFGLKAIPGNQQELIA